MLRDSYHRMFGEFTHSGMMSDFAGNLFRAGQRDLVTSVHAIMPILADCFSQIFNNISLREHSYLKEQLDRLGVHVR
jgi:hypothetical protein